jgi:hypothetical protein
MSQDELFPGLVARYDGGSWEDFDKLDRAAQLDIMKS